MLTQDVKIWLPMYFQIPKLLWRTQNLPFLHNEGICASKIVSYMKNAPLISYDTGVLINLEYIYNECKILINLQHIHFSFV